MSKLVCITKAVGELKEGINRLDVGQICPDNYEPSPYPDTIFMSTNLDVKLIDECNYKGIIKYEIDVNVNFDTNGNPVFSQAGNLIEKDIALEAEQKDAAISLVNDEIVELTIKSAKIKRPDLINELDKIKFKVFKW